MAVTLKEEEVARYLTNLEHKDDALHADYPVIYDLLDECCLDLDLGILKDLMPKYFCIKFVFTYRMNKIRYGVFIQRVYNIFLT